MRVVRLQVGEASAQWVPACGGLLTHLRLGGEGVVPGGQEILWPPQELGWWREKPGRWVHGGMPILFPFAGRVWQQGQEGRYAWGDGIYPMPLHGFAYALPWQLEEHEAGRLSLLLTSSPATLPYFPWHFTARASFLLAPDRLSCCLQVECRGGERFDSEMPVAAGFHPYFPCPAGPLGSPRQGQLDFRCDEVQRVTGTGAAGTIEAGAAFQARSLAETQLHNLILRKVEARQISYAHPSFQSPIAVQAEDDCFFVLWTRNDDDFYCIEPWMALPDAVHNGQGLKLLAPGEQISFAFSLRILC